MFTQGSVFTGCKIHTAFTGMFFTDSSHSTFRLFYVFTGWVNLLVQLTISRNKKVSDKTDYCVCEPGITWREFFTICGKHHLGIKPGIEALVP